MSEQPRDWERELADIDRVIAKQGNTPAASTPPPGGSAPGHVPLLPGRPPARRRSVALTWFWVMVAFALGIALVIWPYQRACGLQLFFYLGAAGITGLIAFLGALASWAHRRGLAHVISLLIILWAGFVALREVLPRIGYARESRTWMCESVPAPSGGPAPVPAPAGPSS